MTPASISRSEVTESDPEEFRVGTAEARAVRANVAVQLSAMIEEMDMTGSQAYLVRRLRELNAAVASEDPMALNAAVMEVGAAAGAWAASIQLSEPVYVSLRAAEAQKNSRSAR
ncbi:MAG: hypothetical protein ACRDPE_15340 [Solirubrobacterales bacterium]